MPFVTTTQLTQVTQQWRRRVLEVGCRVLAPRQPGGPLYLATIFSIQNTRVYVIFDSGSRVGNYDFSQVYPVESWRTERTANPPVLLQSLLMWQMLKKRMTERYDLKAVEAIWLWFNETAFAGKLDPPSFGWISDWNIVGSFDFDRNRMVVNRANNLTINALAETIGHEIIHQYQRQAVPATRITDAERESGMHGDTFRSLQRTVRETTHIEVPFDTVSFDYPTDVSPDFWTTTGSDSFLVLLTREPPLRGGIIVIGRNMPPPGMLRAQYLQPGQRATLWEVANDPRIEGALRGAGKGLVPVNPLIAELIERAGNAVVRL